MRRSPLRGRFALSVLALFALAIGVRVDAAEEPRRSVLVELYTSQGCDMCPEAEKILGEIAGAGFRVVPVAFHVDYFNDPWVDRFSDPLYSQRQSTYNSLYKKPKNPQYGLYYTPMLMIDGEQSVNGRDRPTAEAAIRRAMNRKPEVNLTAKLQSADRGLRGEISIDVSSRLPRIEGRELLICAVVREDGVVTQIESGENAHKTLTARFPARATKFEFVTLNGSDKTNVSFPLELDETSKPERVSVAVFAQDKLTGIVYQAIDLPWKGQPAEASKTKKAR